jgi:hypothetical protein
MNARRNLVAIPAGAVLLVSMAAAPAFADTLFDVGAKATLVARGVAVDIPVHYTCSDSTGQYPYSDITLRLTQVVRGQEVASAEGGISAVCDDTPQTGTVRVTVLGGTAPFKAGAALVDGTLSQTDGMSGLRTPISKEVRIGR